MVNHDNGSYSSGADVPLTYVSYACAPPVHALWAVNTPQEQAYPQAPDFVIVLGGVAMSGFS